MGWIVAIIVGGVFGWLASKVMNTDAQQGVFLNIVVGVVGSFLGGFLGQFLGIGATLTSFSIPGLVMSFVGAVVLLGIVNFVRRGQIR